MNGYRQSDASIVAVLWVGVLALVAAFFAQCSQAQDFSLMPKPFVMATPTQWSVPQEGQIMISPSTTDAIVRAQSLPYLQAVVKSMLPAPPDFKVGKVTAGPGPAIPAKLYGRVTEAATRVTVTVAGVTQPFEATLTPTVEGYPKVWTWTIPELMQCGITQYLRVTAYGSNGTAIGELDNANHTTYFSFLIPSRRPEMERGRIMCFDRANRYLTMWFPDNATSAEVLIDGKLTQPWYTGRTVLSNKRLMIQLKPEVLDGAEHYVQVKVYGRTTATGPVVLLGDIDNGGPAYKIK